MRGHPLAERRPQPSATGVKGRWGGGPLGALLKQLPEEGVAGGVRGREEVGGKPPASKGNSLTFRRV